VARYTGDSSLPDIWRLVLSLESDQGGKQMKAFVRGMISNLGVVRELLGFLWQRKLWWLIPMMLVLLVFALLMVFAAASGIGPFIYTLF
jgi:hypothetical protein